MAVPSHKRKESSPSHKAILSIRESLFEFSSKMKKDKSFCPSVQELDKYAKKIVQFVEKHHKECDKTKSFLKDAIIDLTEIPLMHPQMQRVAIETAIKMSVENIDKFCSKTY